MIWSDREAYRIAKARALIEHGVAGQPGKWADLGCGDGVFTSALCTLLSEEAVIYAVDKDRRRLRALEHNIAESYPTANINTVRADFTRSLPLPLLNGIVMANSLHFVKRKPPIVSQICEKLKPTGRLIVVEYNTNTGNYAVPFAFDEHEFIRLANAAGLEQASIIARVPSRFLGEMYCGIARQPN